MSMFCYQCEQSGSQATGCTIIGTCGKDPQTAKIQDIIIHLAKGIAMYLYRARELGATQVELDKTLLDALVYTVTNVNFDTAFLARYLDTLIEKREQARQLYETACAQSQTQAESLSGPASWQPVTPLAARLEQSEEIAVDTRKAVLGEDIVGLQELLLYGLKGTAAYAQHAYALGHERPEFYAFLEHALDYLTEELPQVDELLRLSLKCGEENFHVMALLDRAHSEHFGAPEPTAVRVTPVKGHCILVSGHDLHDLATLLEATQGLGINIYTHGEMLPAHGYPKLKQYPHLVGNYGGAWQNQNKEFEAFPGAILMTTNCIQKPLYNYQDRLFTTGLVGWPGVQHLQTGDWQPLIDAALAAPGFSQDEAEKTITVGFGHQAVLGVADKIVAAVKSGQLRRFFLIGGCDGAKMGRNYYTQLAQAVPDDCAILTLACGKYRFNKLDFGEIAGLPRLLDVGQCNDAYSAIQIASALADAFDTEINNLPLSLMISWYEQKAVAVLLTLFYLNIQNIHLGPTLPPFLTPALLRVLSEQFAVRPISTAEADLKVALSS